jgi:Xaa-Pro aminopeptidase
MNKLIIADSFTNSDQFYSTKVLIPDPFISLQTKSKSYILANSLEFSRIVKESPTQVKVLPLEKYSKDLKSKFKNPTLATIAYLLLKEKNIKSIEVPATFPVLYADFLRKNKIKLKIKSPFYKQRIIKTHEEIKQIEKVQKIAEKAFNYAITIIKKAKIKNSFLYHKNKKLTSEFLKQEIQKIFSQNNLESPEDLILSSGLDTAFPHKTGTGPIKAGVPIILDIFPRSIKSRYYTDMTRTVCRGPPKNPKIQEIYNLVLKAQQAAYKKIKPNSPSSSVHNEVLKVFKKHNVEKYFIHSTGHGVGIDIHESPGIPSKTKLKPGMVITNEPGLYIEGVGGVRLEDIILVTETGYKNLVKLPKQLVI